MVEAVLLRTGVVEAFLVTRIIGRELVWAPVLKIRFPVFNVVIALASMKSKE